MVEEGEMDGGLKVSSRKKAVVDKREEFETDAGVEEQVVCENMRSVYLDTDKGIWRCQYCIWTYKVNTSCTDQLPNYEGHHLGVIDVKTFSQHRTLFDSKTKGDKMSDEQRDTVSPAIEVHTPPIPHEIIEEKLKDAEVDPLYDKDSQVSLRAESLLHEEPEIDMRENMDNVIQDKRVEDDSYKGSETVEADLFRPPWRPEQHQPKEMADALILGGELPPKITDSIGRHVKPGEPEPVSHVPSTPNRENLFEKIKIETPDKLNAPESGSKGDKTSDEHCDTVSPAMKVDTSANPHEIVVEKLKDAEVKPLYDKDNSQAPLKEESLLHEEPQMDMRENLANATQNKSGGDDSYEGSETVEVDLSSPSWLPEEHQSEEITDASTPGGELPTNINDSIGRNAELAEPESMKSVQSTFNQTNLFEEIKIETSESLDAPESGSKVDQTIGTPEEVITTEVDMERPPQSDSSLLTTIPTGVTQDHETKVYIGVQTNAPTEAGERHQWEWDVLKAIVYGGLLESIASLGVISSAEASDVTTLNIVSLGLANLAGGLPVLIYNLVELKNKQHDSLDEKEQVDLYVELLGKRGHFYRHATIALLSYIFVGILPPLIYGFTFRESDNKEFKLLVVASASLLCIALLAIGKAHVQGRKTYGKTLLHYLGLGMGASGLSYAVGILIRKLLESLGLFDDSAAVSSSPVSSILEVMSTNLPRTS